MGAAVKMVLEPTDLPFQTQIAQAFADVPYPQGGLAMGTADDSAVPSRITGVLAGRPWQEAAAFAQAAALLPGLTAEAFHYFLPAYLIAAIEGDSQGAATLTAFTCLCPTYAGPEWRINVFDKRAHRFNAQQAAAIVTFLEHPSVVDELMLERPDSPFAEDWKAALDYWRRRSDAPR